MPGQAAKPRGLIRPPPSGQVTDQQRITVGMLSAPPVRPGIVDRSSLLDYLRSAAHVPVVLVSAPAGYGKTTLMALWHEHDERPFAWVSLDAADNDPVVFVSNLLTALGPLLRLDGSLADVLATPQPPLEDVILPSLVSASAGAGRPFVLVLDDLHLVTERRCHAAIGYLVERLPAGCQLALATRTDPMLPLGSLRAHGHLAELRAAQLSLGTAEAGALLAAAGVPQRPDLVARLVERTEGWPAAMYLAALSLRGRADPGEFVDRFTGTSRHVADFLTEDVLVRQPENIIDFLLRTCLLEELTASLCDAVTGASGAGATLRELERSNLFVVPLDEERQAYRYHHLFAQYLRAELAHRQPGLVPELHRRAWRWYRDHALIGRAVAHAQACGDVEAAAGMVLARWFSMAENGQFETVRTWMTGFSDAQIEAHAPLAIAAAWIAALVGERERSARFAEAARCGSWDGPMPDGSASLESALAIMAATGLGSGDLSKQHAAAQQVVDLEPVTSMWRPLALLSLGTALALEGDSAAGRVALDEALLLTGGQTTISALALAHLALISMREGDEARAFGRIQQAHAVVERPGMRTHMPVVIVLAVMAHLLARRGELDQARLAVNRAHELLPRLTEANWVLMIETRILLAPVLVTLERRDEAVAYLDEAARLLTAHPDAGELPRWLDEAARKLHHRRLPKADDLTDAERRILRLLATNLTLREIGRELYLSMNTVKTHTSAIYRKLGVSSRAAAVRAAADQHGESPG